MLELENRYRLSFYEKLGNLSDHSHVSLVRHVDTGKICVRKELTNYNYAIYQFLQEHPMEYYPDIVELVEDNGTLYVIEEYIAGITLQQYLEKQGRLTLSQAKHILLQVCICLQFLHAQNPPIIHRDLKPTNIILTENHNVTLIDFNVSRLFEPDQSQDTVIGGTRGFAAPEQYGKHQSDVRTDIYALGVLLHYMLTLDYPANCTYQGEAQKIIEKCTDYYPEKRYQNVRQLIRDVEKLPELYPEETRDTEKRKTQPKVKKDTIQKDAQPDQLHPEEDRPKQPSREKMNFHLPKIHPKRYPFLPPGYRTPKVWKAFLASFGYFFILFFGCTLQVTAKDGETVTSIEVLLNRLDFLAIFLGLVFFWFNYRNIWNHLPLCKNSNIAIRILGIALFSMIYIFLLLFLLSFV